MINIAVCDDEEIICQEIYRLLIEFNPEYTIDIYHSGEELLNSEKIYDLIFLDIEMNGISGMETAEMLRKRNNHELIIFLTSHTEFMPDAFKVKAFRFLCKSVEQDKFSEALKSAEKEILNEKKIALNIKGTVKLININDIICVEAFGDGTYIHLNNDTLESTKSLKYWINEVGTEHFYQSHKSYLVALRYVKSIGTAEVEMHYMKAPISVSRRKLAAFKAAFFNYIRKNSGYM